MLQWMGGSRRKVATSRKSTQKRQKQYFEQRKRKQQNLHMMGSDNCYDSPGISGQSLKEHRSLDILNLLNLSTKAQQCSPFCPEGVLLITAILPLMDPPINGRQYPINTRNFLLLIWCVMMNLMPLQKSVRPAKIMFLFHLKAWVKLGQKRQFILQSNVLESHIVILHCRRMEVNQN
ncbi:uncharacterized protein LOC124828710 isoform X1 [Vigna umbellata]|uniref:uncharacterized protein LOC124828710 isoform X1 n=1 Tax=Vigna umbellata TaxID=87088 RepID=UPI001F5F5026|nr:uncharacterized protein LOC124828710 isoform X1 [Vigna umbellata]